MPQIHRGGGGGTTGNMGAHHLEIGPETLEGNHGLGRYVLLPGSPGRSARIAERLRDARRIENRRRLDVHVGAFETPTGDLDIAVVPTGMGCPSVDIVATELFTLGARRVLRVGTTGTLQPQVRLGDLVIATGAVRDEATSDAYTPRGFPAVADPLLVEALCDAAAALGIDDRVHCGLVHTKDSFFGREFGQGPDAERNKDYMRRLSAAGVLASEMEAAHLFVLGTVFGGAPSTVRALRTRDAKIRVGALLAVIGSPEEGIAPRDVEVAAEDRLIGLGLAGLVALARREGTLAAP